MGSPAHAGIDVLPVSDALRFSGFPRTRGDRTTTATPAAPRQRNVSNGNRYRNLFPATMAPDPRLPPTVSNGKHHHNLRPTLRPKPEPVVQCLP